MTDAESNVLGSLQQDAISIWAKMRLLASTLENASNRMDRAGKADTVEQDSDEIYAADRIARDIVRDIQQLARGLDIIPIQHRAAEEEANQEPSKVAHVN